MQSILGDNYNDCVHILYDIDVLIIGNDYLIIYVDIKDLLNLNILSQENYGGIVSEPYDFVASKNNNFLIIANGRPNILIVDTTDFKATHLISVWDNKYKRYIYDI